MHIGDLSAGVGGYLFFLKFCIAQFRYRMRQERLDTFPCCSHYQLVSKIGAERTRIIQRKFWSYCPLTIDLLLFFCAKKLHFSLGSGCCLQFVFSAFCLVPCQSLVTWLGWLLLPAFPFLSCLQSPGDCGARINVLHGLLTAWSLQGKQDH